jgi:hypothetical protein
MKFWTLAITILVIMFINLIVDTYRWGKPKYDKDRKYGPTDILIDCAWGLFVFYCIL